MSVPDGGDEGAEDWLVPLFELELSKSVDVAGGDDPRGEGLFVPFVYRFNPF